jgi:CTP synthase (UTP-ammonia lyase)
MERPERVVLVIVGVILNKMVAVLWVIAVLSNVIAVQRIVYIYVELKRDEHPFYVGTQAHPELRSRPSNAHPLFRGLIGAALDRQQASRLFEDA